MMMFELKQTLVLYRWANVTVLLGPKELKVLTKDIKLKIVYILNGLHLKFSISYT